MFLTTIFKNYTIDLEKIIHLFQKRKKDSCGIFSFSSFGRNLLYFLYSYRFDDSCPSIKEMREIVRDVNLFVKIEDILKSKVKKIESTEITNYDEYVYRVEIVLL